MLLIGKPDHQQDMETNKKREFFRKTNSCFKILLLFYILLKPHGKSESCFEIKVIFSFFEGFFVDNSSLFCEWNWDKLLNCEQCDVGRITLWFDCKFIEKKLNLTQITCKIYEGRRHSRFALWKLCMAPGWCKKLILVS